MTHSEMIAQGEASVAAYDKRIAEVEKELETAPKASMPVIYNRLERLRYDRTITYNGVENMKEDLRLHPELDNRPELNEAKEAAMNTEKVRPARNNNINWPALWADIDGGMSTADAAKKHNCAEVTIINKQRALRRKQKEAAEAAVEAEIAAAKPPAAEPDAETNAPPEEAAIILSTAFLLAQLTDIAACIGSALYYNSDIISALQNSNDHKACFFLGRQYNHLQSSWDEIQELLAKFPEP